MFWILHVFNCLFLTSASGKFLGDARNAVNRFLDKKQVLGLNNVVVHENRRIVDIRISCFLKLR